MGKEVDSNQKSTHLKHRVTTSGSEREMTTTAFLLDVMTPTQGTEQQSAYPDDMLRLMCPRALSEDGARALSVEDEGLEGALRATAAQSEPRTPFVDWDDLARPVRWWAEDADYDAEATLSLGALMEKASARLMEAPASPASAESKKRARSEEEEPEEGEYYCRREATPRAPPSHCVGRGETHKAVTRR